MGVAAIRFPPHKHDERTDPDLPVGLCQWDIEAQHPFWKSFRSDLALPALAAFCPVGGDQNRDDNFTPIAIFRRTPSGIEHAVVGTMLRPWLDGIASGMSTDRRYPDVPRNYHARIVSMQTRNQESESP